MAMATRKETISEFCGYVRDVCSQPPEVQGNRLETVLARLMDTAVRIASSSLTPKDTVIAALSDEQLAEAMQQHVTFRSGRYAISAEDGVYLQNGAWSMMLEAAKRLRTR